MCVCIIVYSMGLHQDPETPSSESWANTIYFIDKILIVGSSETSCTLTGLIVISSIIIIIENLRSRLWSAAPRIGRQNCS